MNAVADYVFKLDRFAVPQAQVEDFEAKLRLTHDILKGLPGFLWQAVLERTDTHGGYNIATIVVWRDRASLAAARARIEAEHARMGFDPWVYLMENRIPSERAQFRDLGGLTEPLAEIALAV